MINKSKLFEWYTAQEYRFNIGQSKIIQFKHIIQLYAIADIYLITKFGLNLAIHFLIMVAVFTAFAFWIIGYIWDKAGLIHYQVEFMNKRDPAIKQIRKKLKLKEEVVK